MPLGKPAESARKVAIQFYQNDGLKNQFYLENVQKKLKTQLVFNPENGAQLTEPRPFNLMFKTFVGPIRERRKCRLSPPRNRAGDFRAVQKCFGNVAAKSPVRHRAGRQGVPQRSHAAQFHLPLARVRADGTGIFHQAGRSHRSHPRQSGSRLQVVSGSQTLQLRNSELQPATELGLAGVASILGRGTCATFTKASGFRARRSVFTFRPKKNSRITPAPARIFCSSSRSAKRTRTAT